jgi:ABC-2 type transport system ATP-binding protein
MSTPHHNTGHDIVGQRPAVEVEHVVKRFGDVVAVDGVSLSVPAGTILGLLGPNGAGKTTIVRMLTTILKPTEGRASVLGLDVTREAAKVREVIGLAGQFAAVDENLTGRENLDMVSHLVHLPRRQIAPRIVELLEEFGLTHAADRPAKTYSGGMRRRLDLAAALVHRPPVLFLDEPTTGLDPRSRNDLWTVIANLVQTGTTVLLTTQYLEEADRLADNIAVIDHGVVIAEGTAAELKTSLGRTIVDVVFDDGDTAARAATVLTPLGEGDPLILTNGVEIKVDDGTQATFAVVRALDAAGITARSLTVREPSLDDVFLSLTGQPRAADPTVDDPAVDDPTVDQPAARGDEQVIR